MRTRCNHDKDYINIKVCKRWDDFWLWLKDMGEPPSKKHQIDRINSLRDYKPSNSRWALPYENAYNKNTYKNNKTGKKGVSVKKTKNGPYYVARISVKNKRIIILHTSNIKEAIEARVRAEELYPDMDKLLFLKKEYENKRSRTINSSK